VAQSAGHPGSNKDTLPESDINGGAKRLVHGGRKNGCHYEWNVLAGSRAFDDRDEAAG